MDLDQAGSSEEHAFVELKKKREQGIRYSQVVELEGDGVGGDQAWVDRTRSAHVIRSPGTHHFILYLSGPEITELKS